MLVIVPNHVRDSINRALDTAIAGYPDAEKDRAVLYQQLLDYFHVHGVIPAFSLHKNVEAA